MVRRGRCGKGEHPTLRGKGNIEAIGTAFPLGRCKPLAGRYAMLGPAAIRGIRYLQLNSPAPAYAKGEAPRSALQQKQGRECKKQET